MKFEHTKKIEYKKVWSKKLAYPKQFIIPGSNFATVGINKQEVTQISKDLGRKISFLMKLREKEGSSVAFKTKSILLNRIIFSSNCHRVLLFLFGFKVGEILEQNFGSDIIEKYFVSLDKMIPNEKGNIESEIIKYSKEDFPLAVNFYYFDPRTKTEVPDPTHSLVVLGVSDSGKIICFHKDGIGDKRDVEITTLDHVYENRNSDRTTSNSFTIHSQKEVSEIYKKFKQDREIK